MGQSVASEEYLRYRICKEMGWDFYTFENQPQFFLDEIAIYLKQESEKEKSSSDSHSANINQRPRGHSRY